MDCILENIQNVENRINEACKKSNRDPKEITLIGVSKTRPVELVNDSIEKGINHIGENRVQEIRQKYDLIEKDVVWHMIGHLQTNKVKYIIDKIDLFHSVDRIELAKEISKRAVNIGKTVEVLIQVNVAEEKQKSGVYVDYLKPLIDDILALPNIKIIGLMNIAPYSENPENTRMNFRTMKTLFDDISNEYGDKIDMKYLSMGMSNDFEIAIEEGSNLIRVGTSIYGQRNYL